jgi:hypothetical protein
VKSARPSRAPPRWISGAQPALQGSSHARWWEVVFFKEDGIGSRMKGYLAIQGLGYWTLTYWTDACAMQHRLWNGVLGMGSLDHACIASPDCPPSDSGRVGLLAMPCLT